MIRDISRSASPTRFPSGSEIVHVDVMGSHIVILNSTKAAHELLDKRPTIYSDRYDLDGQSRVAHLWHLLIHHVTQTTVGSYAKAVDQIGFLVIAL
jgi:hypothetical protein